MSSPLEESKKIRSEMVPWVPDSSHPNLILPESQEVGRAIQQTPGHFACNPSGNAETHARVISVSVCTAAPQEPAIITSISP